MNGSSHQDSKKADSLKSATAGEIKGLLDNTPYSLPAFLADSDDMLAIFAILDSADHFVEKIAIYVSLKLEGKEVSVPEEGHLEVLYRGALNVATSGTIKFNRDEIGRRLFGSANVDFSDGTTVRSLQNVIFDASY